MNKSDSIKELATALSKFQASMGAISKDSNNPFFKSKYASLSTVIEDTRQPLAKVGLSFAQFPVGDSELMTILMHTSGEFISASYQMKPVRELAKDERVLLRDGNNNPIFKDPTPQAVGSGISYGRRYALCSILGLQVEDDDGNEASKPRPRYDNTPIEDTDEVTSTGADDINEVVPGKVKTAAAPRKAKTTIQDKKREVKDLIDLIVMNPLENGDAYRKYVLEQTGLTLIDSNLDEILIRLKALN